MTGKGCQYERYRCGGAPSITSAAVHRRISCRRSRIGTEAMDERLSHD